MRKLRFVAAAVLMCSWACAGGDAPDPSGSDGELPPTGQELPSTPSAAPAQVADDAQAEVVSGSQNPTTEGSNTNWMPTQPWLDDLQRPQAHERPDPRKPGGGQQGNPISTPHPDRPSFPPEQPGESSASGSSSSASSSGSNDSTPSPDE